MLLLVDGWTGLGVVRRCPGTGRHVLLPIRLVWECSCVVVVSILPITWWALVVVAVVVVLLGVNRPVVMGDRAVVIPVVGIEVHRAMGYLVRRPQRVEKVVKLGFRQRQHIVHMPAKLLEGLSGVHPSSDIECLVEGGCHVQMLPPLLVEGWLIDNLRLAILREMQAVIVEVKVAVVEEE